MNRRVVDTLWVLIALTGLLLWTGCGDDGGGEADTGLGQDIVDTAPLPEQSVALEIVGTLANGATQTYDVAGTSYDLTIDKVYVVAGNVTVLGPGDPVPTFAPGDGEADPLAVGARSVEGYQVVDLLEGVTFGPVDVPQGYGGPVYLAMVTADSSADPLDGKADVPAIDEAMLLLQGSISVGGTFEKDVEFKLGGDRLLIVGAPAFETTQPRVVRITVDLDGWFSDIDVNALSHSTNTIFINANENEAAFTAIGARVHDALDNATIAID